MTCDECRIGISARLDGEDPGARRRRVSTRTSPGAPTAAPSTATRGAPPRAASPPRRRSPTSRPASSPPSAPTAGTGAGDRRTSTRALDPGRRRARADRDRGPRAACSASDAGLPVHTARHIGSFDVALGVGFLFARGSRAASRACCRWSSRSSPAWSGRRCSTSRAAARAALGESHHVTDCSGSRLPGRRAGDGCAAVGGTRLWCGPRDRRLRRHSCVAGSSCRCSSRLVLLRAPASRARRCSPPTRSPAACTTRRRSEITLRFTEPVESRARRHPRLRRATASAIVTDARSTRTATGARSGGAMPKLDDGTYVVTWRVTSADSHPIEGAFTFQVGGRRRRDESRTRRAREPLLAEQGGTERSAWSTASTGLMLFAGLALLIGGRRSSRGRGLATGAPSVEARERGGRGRLAHDGARHRARRARVRAVRRALVSGKMFTRARRRRRARHAVRAGVRSPPRAARARVPVAAEAAARRDATRPAAQAWWTRGSRRWSASAAARRDARRSPATRPAATGPIAAIPPTRPRAGDGVWLGGLVVLARRGAAAGTTSDELRRRRSSRSPRSRSAAWSRWSSPARSRRGARSAASTRCRTPTTGASSS